MTGYTVADRSAWASTVQGYRPIAQILPAHWRQQTVYANGIRHGYYRTGGDKPAVVLLHGLLDGALTWLRTARALEADYDVVLVGRSDRVAATFTQALLNEDAAGVIRVLRLGKPRLLGHSQGGATGIHVAAAYPNLVHSLIVEGWGIEAPAQPNQVDLSKSPGYLAWYNAYLAWLEQLATQTHVERMVATLAQLPPGAPLPDEESYVTWVETCARLDLELVRHSMSLWANVQTRGRAMVEALGQTTCPVLIMKSAMFPQRGAPQFVQEEASSQPNVRILRFENTGHVIHGEQFDQFIAAVRTFFQSNENPPLNAEVIWTSPSPNKNAPSITAWA